MLIFIIIIVGFQMMLIMLMLPSDSMTTKRVLSSFTSYFDRETQELVVK